MCFTEINCFTTLEWLMKLTVDVAVVLVVVDVVVVVLSFGFDVGLVINGKWCWSRSQTLGAKGGTICEALSRSFSS